jgi:SAM-dependent methyltransferase/uncharacterized protein YbaR (Trm112 family)
MRREHLERLQPVCPVCRAGTLELGAVAREDGDEVLEGVLVCASVRCRREHPIVDGIPVVVADIASWASHQLDSVLRRDDLTAFTEGLLGDASGAGTSFDRERINLSGYGHGHYGPGGGFPALVGTALSLLDEPPSGVWADLGCAVGRGTMELARTCSLAVGVDLSFSMLRVAERARRTGRAVFPQRRVGMVYERVSVELDDVPADRMSFWCADVGVLPFADGTFDGGLSLNVLDCVPSPLGHLIELGRTLAPGAPAVLSTPYDWSTAATSVDQWLGGHSQRGDAEGASEPELRRILSADAAAGIDTGLVIDAERDGVPWRVHANARSSVEYSLHLLRLRRV